MGEVVWVYLLIGGDRYVCFFLAGVDWSGGTNRVEQVVLLDIKLEIG